MAGSSPCVAREMCSRTCGGSGCWDSVPGSLQLELGFKAVASERERQTGESHKAESAGRSDKMSR